MSDALERDGLEALVATSAANVAYVAGFSGLTEAGSTPRRLAIFTRRGTALVIPTIEAPAAVIDEAEVDHVVCFGDFPAAISESPGVSWRRLESALDHRAASLPEALGLALGLLGVRSGTIGVDESGLRHREWERVNERLGHVKVVNGTDHLAAARRVKAPFEIECLQRALGIAEEALNEVIQTLVRGTTEREAAAAYGAETVKRGADPRRVLVSMGERTSLPLAWPTDRALRPGELVRFDVGCVYRGYHAGVVRTGALGEPTREHDVHYGALLAGVEAAIDGAVAGRSAGDVLRAAIDAVRAHGLARYQLDHVGHGIGLEACESPALAPGDLTTLEAGEVLQIAVPFYEVGGVGFGVKETVLVAMTEARLLNRSARGLVTLD
ncbi:MAG: M24 family metallopeptidase [Candidatus Rokuibacteriota bacterium]